MINQILISIILGLIPEVLYFTLFITFAKNFKTKRIKLFLLISIAYIICMFIQRYKILYYVLFVALIYGILKLLYRDEVEIIDVFLIMVTYLYLTIISVFCFYFVKNNLKYYYLALFFNRILLFLPFAIRDKFNKIYTNYYKLWNRNSDENRPIKSITLRNISLIIINLLICYINILCIYINNIS